MNALAAGVEHYLRPGELWFDAAPTRLRTLLGTCVAITLWHPGVRVGGMCHYLLPGRSRADGVPLDARYADEALQILVQHMLRRGTRPKEYVAKIFGGSSRFAGAAGAIESGVGERNVGQARALLGSIGIDVHAESVGGSGYRNILLDLATGEVFARHVRAR